MAYKDLNKERAMRRKNYHLNQEAKRAKSRRNKRAQRKARQEEINTYQREWYAKHRVDEAAKQSARRICRLPYIGLRKAIRDSERGAFEIYGLIELLRQRLAASNGVNGSAKGIRPGDRRVYGAVDAPVVKEHLRDYSDEDGDS